MRSVVAFGLSWIALFWLWLVFTGEWDRYEWAAAAAAATVGAAFTLVLVRAGLLRFRFPLRVLPQALKVPPQVVVDFGIVSLALLRRLSGTRVRGRFVARRFDSAGGGALGAGDRAAREVLAAYSPNAYPVDIDPGRHRTLLHDLVPNRKSEEPL